MVSLPDDVKNYAGPGTKPVKDAEKSAYKLGDGTRAVASKIGDGECLWSRMVLQDRRKLVPLMWASR